MAYPFRIERRAPIAAAAAGKPGDAELADYMDRLVRLIPAEVLGVYLIVRGFWGGTAELPADSTVSSGFLEWWPVFCVFLVILSRLWGTRDASRKFSSAQLPGTGIAVISFIIWVYAMGHTILGWMLPDPRFASTAVILWVFVVPYFYVGSKP